MGKDRERERKGEKESIKLLINANYRIKKENVLCSNKGITNHRIIAWEGSNHT